MNASLWVRLTLGFYTLYFATIHPSLGQENKYQIVFQDLAWSPDGNLIAFTSIKVKSDWSDYSPEKWSLFLYDLNAHSIEKVNSGCLYLSFSPDGKKLAYDKKTEGNTDIYLMELEDRSVTKLIGHPSKDGGPSWSPDGNAITFYSDRSGNEEIYVFNISDGKTIQITHSDVNKSYNPVWSPVSNWILYYLDKGDSKDQIFLTDNQGSFHKNITEDSHHNIYPFWTPDGKILYSRDEGELMQINSDGTGKKPFVNFKSKQITISPDSGFLLYVSIEQNSLHIYDLKNDSDKLLILGSDIQN